MRQRQAGSNPTVQKQTLSPKLLSLSDSTSLLLPPPGSPGWVLNSFLSSTPPPNLSFYSTFKACALLFSLSILIILCSFWPLPHVKVKLRWTLAKVGQTDFVWSTAVGKRLEYRTELDSKYSWGNWGFTANGQGKRASGWKTTKRNLVRHQKCGNS